MCKDLIHQKTVCDRINQPLFKKVMLISIIQLNILFSTYFIIDNYLQIPYPILSILQEFCLLLFGKDIMVSSIS